MTENLQRLGQQVALSLMVMLLAGCATPYQSMGFTGGVDVMQVNETTYRIIATGNGWTSSQRVREFVLLRASEIAIGREYKGFVINAAADQSSIAQITSPGYATTTTNGAGKPLTAVFVTLVQQGGMDARMTYSNLAPKYISDQSRLASPTPIPTDADADKAVTCKEAGGNVIGYMQMNDCARMGGTW